MRSLLSILAFYCSFGSFAQISLDAKDFQQAIADSSVQLLDVRTAEEYETGYISGALQANWNSGTEFMERVAAMDKTKPVYIYCLGGGRSTAAQKWMLNNGFTQVVNLTGGINAWNQAELPVTAIKTVPQTSKKEFLSTIPATGTVLVDFGAEWCPPCKKMKPIVEELKAEGTHVIYVDGGEQKELCKDMSVTAFPTFIVFKDGREISRKQGVFSTDDLKKMLVE